MSDISAVFESNRKALIAYVTVGYPDIESTSKVVPLLAENGCDIIELGIPFSDPLADGVTIQKASYQALQNGVTVQLCLKIARRLGNNNLVKNKNRVPLVFMTYFNPVLNYGLEKFCCDCLEAGVSGLIVPDLPPEEGAELEACACRQKVDVIYLLAPNSTDNRIKLVAERSKGFIYLVSLTGVTGARDRKPVGLEDFITKVRKVARQPLCVGFGISTPEQAHQIGKVADGVIIGSRIIQLMESDPTLNTVAEFIRDVRKALDMV